MFFFKNPDHLIIIDLLVLVKRIGYILLLLLIILASVIVPIYMILEGARSLDLCPRMPWIPKWLIILGGIVFSNTVVNFGILGFFSMEKIGRIKRVIQMTVFLAHLILVILGKEGFNATTTLKSYYL